MCNASNFWNSIENQINFFHESSFNVLTEAIPLTKDYIDVIQSKIYNIKQRNENVSKWSVRLAERYRIKDSTQLSYNIGINMGTN